MPVSKMRRPTASPNQTPQRQAFLERQAFLAAVRSLESIESPDVMQIVTQVVAQALTVIPAQTKSKAKEQDAPLEWKALQRTFASRRVLLQDAITTTQVAQLLGVSPRAIRERGRQGQLLGVLDGGRLRFPLWQFDPAGSGGVVEGLPPVLRAFDEAGPLPPLAKMSWLVKPSVSLGGATPLEALRGGRLAETLSAARAAVAS
jgi:hypothetical protein